MKRLPIAPLALLAACTWSNSLYQARLLSKNAVRAERDNQPGQAQSLWGQVFDKAESAYVRSPQGKRGAEALWLAGHSAARTRDCRKAIPALQGALASQPHAAWEQQLLLDLAECEEALGSPTAAAGYAAVLARSTNPAVRREARLRQGHVFVVQQEWDAALAALAGEDTLPARLDRATAYAHLGRASEALAELAPALSAADTSVKWQGYIETFAVRNSTAADSLLNHVLAFPTLPAPRRATLLLGAARSAIGSDPDAATRWLQQLDVGAPGPLNEARLLQQQLLLTRPASPTQLRPSLEAAAGIDVADAGIGGRRLLDLLRYGRELLVLNDSTAPGAPQGDLMLFALGELARDSLGSSHMSSWFFARIEREWPQSPYTAKAIFARIELEPDSADVLRSRVRALAANPYVAAANGEAAGRATAARLEDSLSTFISRLWAGRRKIIVDTVRL